MNLVLLWPIPPSLLGAKHGEKSLFSALGNSRTTAPLFRNLSPISEMKNCANFLGRASVLENLEGRGKNALNHEKSENLKKCILWLMVYLQVIYPVFAAKIGSHAKHDPVLSIKSSGTEVASSDTQLSYTIP
uniref:Uncharacterized protein n=1 Tax=Romanomermis culicivorax TaxID=13658 RepID=A0A915JMZ4_ROMCU